MGANFHNGIFSLSISLSFEDDDAQRGESQRQRMLSTMKGNRRRANSTHISLAASPIIFGVAVQYFPPETLGRDSDPIIRPRHGSEIADDEDGIFRRPSLAKEADDAVFPVAEIDPGKSLGIKIKLMQRPFFPMKTVQVFDPELNSSMRLVLEEMPIQAVIVDPFTPLSEFTPHE
jgi:hypothetical protein